jgi:hypothetical protein
MKMLKKSDVRFTHKTRRIRQIRLLQSRIERLEREIAELRARPPVVYQPVWVTPTIPVPTWDPLRPYCAPVSPSMAPDYWPKTICSSGDAAAVHAALMASGPGYVPP